MKNKIIQTIERMAKDMPLMEGQNHILFDMFHVMYDGKEIQRVTEKTKNKHIDTKINAMKKFDTVDELMLFITKPYYLTVLYEITSYLTDDELNRLMKDCWVSMEFPNSEDTDKLYDLWNLTTKEKLMNADERKIFDLLPEVVTIYRGLQHESSVEAFSWTLDIEKAKWFANRFNRKGEVYSAQINKKDIFMYTDERNEQEVVVDPYKLKDVCKVI